MGDSELHAVVADVADVFDARDEEEKDAARFLLREKICSMSHEQFSRTKETVIKLMDVLVDVLTDMLDNNPEGWKNG